MTMRQFVRRWIDGGPAFWTRLGPATTWLARRRPPLAPPLLLLSPPRSGSSWIGATLGRAANAAYLREPLTSAYHAAGGAQTMIAVDPAGLPPAYAAAADAAFAGLPRFGPAVIPFPAQWGWRQRGQRHVVVKEVNPRAAAWLLAVYRPRLILLTRHPAAVALSYQRLGWHADRPDFWTHLGQLLGAALAAAWTAAGAYEDRLVVCYEAVCYDPEREFRRLYDFAGLQWPADLTDVIHRETSGGQGNLARDSRARADGWRSEVTPAALAELGTAYRAFDLPWYSNESDWRL